MTRHLLLLVPFVALAGSAAAQEAPAPLPARLSLAEAIARATETSHRLGELRARESASRAVVGQRAAAQNPILSAQLGYQRTNHVDPYGFLSPTGFKILYPDVPDNLRSRIELQWPIYTGGRLQALERAASAEAAATGKDLEAARADLKLEVTRAFWALVTAREAARVVAAAVTRVEAQLADVRSRYDAGFVPPNDVMTVEAQLARQRVLYLDADNLAVVAEADLARLIGAPDGARIELDAVLEDEAATAPQPAPESLFGAARANRADRAAIEFRIGAASERETAAAAGRRPTVSFLSGADYAKPNPKIFPREDIWQPSWDVGVSVNWSFWDWGRTRADVAEAVAVSAATRERLAEYDSQLAFEIRQRSVDLASARGQLDAARQEVTSAAEARRVLEERVRAGVATTTDLLDAQVALLQAELDRTRALAGIRLAQARLDRAVGR